MKKTLIFLLYLCSGIVIGSLIAETTSDIKALSWLSYGESFGITSPLVLDLKAIQIVLGISFNLNISVIIFMALSVFVYTRTFTSSRRR